MENIDEVKKFLIDIDCLDEIKKYKNEVNIFDVLKLSRNEITHSNVLAWLLDANGSHGLGSKFIDMLLREIIKNSNNQYNIEDWSFLDYESENVQREWHKKTTDNKNRSLDILITLEGKNKGEGNVVAIENKIDSIESDEQTKDYWDALENTFPKYKKMGIYLTVDGSEANNENWAAVSYRQVLELLEKINSSEIDESNARVLFDNYRKLLKEEIVGDEKLVALCTKIYNEHKAALDIIFENKMAETAIVADLCKKAVKSLSDETDSIIIYDEKYNSGITYVRFASKKLDEIFKRSDADSPNGWNNTLRHLWEINVRELKYKDDLQIFLTFTRNNINDEIREKQDKIINHYKGKDSKGTKFASLNKEELLEQALVNVEENDENIIVDALKEKIVEYVKKYDDKISKLI